MDKHRRKKNQVFIFNNHDILAINPTNGDHFSNSQDEYDEWSSKKVNQVQNELSTLIIKRKCEKVVIVKSIKKIEMHIKKKKWKKSNRNSRKKNTLSLQLKIKLTSIYYQPE